MKNVVITVLAVLVLAMGGYLVYDKIIDKDDKIEGNKLEENNNKQTENDYQSFTENLKKQTSNLKSGDHVYQYIENDIIPDGYAVYLDENRSLYVKYYNEDFNNKFGQYKISDNILSFYVINVGQDEGNMLYFINEDGTVGSADTEYGVSNGDQLITVKNDIGYKNIVSIVNGIFGSNESGVHGPIFIDINGNIFYQ